jgi:hypothetical protein
MKKPISLNSFISETKLLIKKRSLIGDHYNNDDDEWHDEVF